MNHQPQFYTRTSRPMLRLLPWRTVVINEHEFALHYRDGHCVGQLPTGLHRLWGRHSYVVSLDRRRQLLDIPAQELATADGVTLKVTAQVAWQIMDPLAAITRDADHHQTLYAAAQQAVRAAAAAHPLASINAQRSAIAQSMRECISVTVQGIGLTIHEAVLKDVMPSAETRKAMAAVAFAKQEALASLEKARGEQAALRALANAARLMKEQPELAQVRGLQILSEGLRAGASVVVNTNATGLLPAAR